MIDCTDYNRRLALRGGPSCTPANAYSQEKQVRYDKQVRDNNLYRKIISFYSTFCVNTLN